MIFPEGNQNYYSHKQQTRYPQVTPCLVPWTSKLLNQARQAAYWPGLFNELQDLVYNCHVCLEHINGNHKKSAGQEIGWEILLIP